MSGNVVMTENFDGSAVSFTANSVDNPLGSLSVSLTGGVGDAGPTGLTGGGFFQSEVDGKGTDKLSIDIAIGDAYGFALGGLQNDSLSKPSKLSLKDIAIGVGPQHWVLSDLLGKNKSDVPFLGFASDDVINDFQFLSARLFSSKAGTSEEFYLDRLLVALAPTPLPPMAGGQGNAVPEPSAIWLLLAGLPGFMGMKRGLSGRQVTG